MRSNKHIYTSVLIINIHYIQNNVIKRRKFSASDFFLNYWNTSLQNKLQTDELKPILLISEGHLPNGPTRSEQKVSSGHYKGVLSAQFKAVGGLVQQDLQGQRYHCPREGMVQVSSKRFCFFLPRSAPPHSLMSLLSQHFPLGCPILLLSMLNKSFCRPLLSRAVFPFPVQRWAGVRETGQA